MILREIEMTKKMMRVMVRDEDEDDDANITSEETEPKVNNSLTSLANIFKGN